MELCGKINFCNLPFFIQRQARENFPRLVHPGQRLHPPFRCRIDWNNFKEYQWSSFIP